MSDFLILTLLILFTSESSIFPVLDLYAIVFFIVLSFMFYRKGCKLEMKVLVVFFVWLLINFISLLLINTSAEFSFISFLGVTLRMSLSYLIYKIIGSGIMDKLIRYIYLLTIISIILFTIQLIDVSLFYSLSRTLNFMTLDAQTNAGGWYIFIYMFSGWGFDRNCGFMFEPGSFALILIFAIIQRLTKNNWKIDKMILVFTVGVISTLSTAGYLALFFIIIAFFIENKIKLNQPILIFLLMFFFYFAFIFYSESEFMGKKINEYKNAGIDYYEVDADFYRVTRLGIAIIALDYSTYWPFGNGILESQYKINKYGKVYGPNGLVEILTVWGWIGLFFFLTVFFKFNKSSCKSVLSNIFLILSLCIVMFSNPLLKYFFYLFFFYNMLDKAKEFRLVPPNGLPERRANLS